MILYAKLNATCQANGRDRSFLHHHNVQNEDLGMGTQLMFAESAILRKWVWPLLLARARNGKSGEECCLCRYKQTEEVS